MRLAAPFRWIIRRASAAHRRLLRSGRAPAGLGRHVLLLTTVRPDGRRVTVPLFYARIGENLHVVPSFGGNDDPPDWYRNLQDDPRVWVECDGKRRELRARTLEPEETVAVWPCLLRIHSGYAGYQRRTRRWISVVQLSP